MQHFSKNEYPRKPNKIKNNNGLRRLGKKQEKELFSKKCRIAIEILKSYK